MPEAEAEGLVPQHKSSIAKNIYKWLLCDAVTKRVAATHLDLPQDEEVIQRLRQRYPSMNLSADCSGRSI